MDFLYFPEDKSEYIPGIISVIIIFVLSVLIVRLLIKASRKQVRKDEEEGYPKVYKDGFDLENADQDPVEPQKTVADASEHRNMQEKNKI